MRAIRVGLSLQMVLLFGLLTAIATIVLVAFIYSEYRNSHQQQVQQQIEHTLQSQVNAIRNHIRLQKSETIDISQDPLVRTIMPLLQHEYAHHNGDKYRELNQKLRTGLTPRMERNHIYDIFLIDLQGEIIFTMTHEADFATNLVTGPFRHSALAKATHDAMDQIQPQISTVKRYAPSNNASALFIAVPLMGINGRLLGVVAIQNDASHLRAIAANYTNLGASGETVIASSHNNTTLMMMPLRHDADAAFRRTIKTDSAIAMPMHLALQGKSGHGFWNDYRDIPVFAAWGYVPELQWGVVVKIDQQEALRELQSTRHLIILITLGILLVVIGLAVLFGRFLTYPIEQLSIATERVTRGDFNTKVPTIHGALEIHQLTDTFNLMLTHMQQASRSIEASFFQIQKQKKQLESALQQASTAQMEAEISRTQAEQANNAKTEFLSSMSHELRTPLNAVLGFGQILEQSPLEAKQEKCVRHILDGGHHLLNLVNDVLDLAKLDSGKIAVKQESVLLGSLCEECATMMQPLASQYGITLQFPANSETLPPLRADAFRLKQVMLNLISNGIKYGDSQLTIETLADDNMARIWVHNDGDPIPTAKHDQLFQPFSRLGREAGEIEGSGIGLVISKRLMEMMGGAIGLDADVATGTTFWIDVPIDRDPRPT
ncbi:MAG: ATP-binding protein [Mariprofundales bacterium]